MNRNLNNQKGFTLFFAILVIGLMMGVVTSITLLAAKQLSLTNLGKQSELAFYAADSAAECTEYWDNYGPNPFSATNTAATSITCNGMSVPVSAATPTGSGGGSRTFSLTNLPCASVTIVKTPINGYYATNITSQGFDLCNTSAKRLERTLYLSY